MLVHPSASRSLVRQIPDVTHDPAGDRREHECGDIERLTLATATSHEGKRTSGVALGGVDVHTVRRRRWRG